MSASLDSKKILFLQLLLTLVLSCLLLSPNFTAQFGMIDDHEIMRFLGSKISLPLGEVFSQLQHTEAWVGNVSTRYRPAYYLLRLIETACWGDSAFGWYSTRVVLCWLTAFLTWRACMRHFGTILGGICTLLFFSNHYWADIFARLGPSEAYCAFGLALYVLSFVRLWDRDQGNPDLWWALLCLASLICIGSKENFLVLLPVTCVLSYRTFASGKMTKFAFCANAVIYLFGIFVALVLMIALRKGGVDVYQNPVTPAARVKRLLTALSSPESLAVFTPFCYGIVYSFVLLLLERSRYLKERGQDLAAKAKRIFFIESSLAALCLTQVVFYNGLWPTGIRYDFPGIVAVNLGYFVLVHAVATLLCDLYLRPSPLTSFASPAIAGFLLLVYFLLSGAGELLQIHDLAQANSLKTRTYLSDLQRIIGTVKSNPLRPIVLETNSVWDIEPVFSLRTYFKSYRVANPIVIKTNFASFSDKGIENSLTKRLVELSRNGAGSTGYQDKVYPLALIDNYRDFYVVTFSGGSQLGGNDLGRIW